MINYVHIHRCRFFLLCVEIICIYILEWNYRVPDIMAGWWHILLVSGRGEFCGWLPCVCCLHEEGRNGTIFDSSLQHWALFLSDPWMWRLFRWPSLIIKFWNSATQRICFFVADSFAWTLNHQEPTNKNDVEEHTWNVVMLCLWLFVVAVAEKEESWYLNKSKEKTKRRSYNRHSHSDKMISSFLLIIESQSS